MTVQSLSIFALPSFSFSISTPLSPVTSFSLCPAPSLLPLSLLWLAASCLPGTASRAEGAPWAPSELLLAPLAAGF